MTKDEALKMAILNLEVCASLMATHEYSDDFYQSVSDAIDVCKEALESQEIGDAEIRQMLKDIEYYQKRIEELESKEKKYDINEMIDKITPENLQEPLSWDSIGDIGANIADLGGDIGGIEKWIQFARAIEAAHGIGEKE